MEHKIGFALAVLGSVLGVLNTWRAMNKDKIKIKVIPKGAIALGGALSNINVAIEVINLSSFPVTIKGVGFLVKKGKARMCLLEPIFLNQERLPMRLEPRESFTAYSILDNKSKREIKTAYAETSCGYQSTGTSNFLKSFSQVN